MSTLKKTLSVDIPGRPIIVDITDRHIIMDITWYKWYTYYHSIRFTQGGAAPVIRWFQNPINYSYLRIKTHSYRSYKRTNLAIPNWDTTVHIPHVMTIFPPKSAARTLMPGLIDPVSTRPTMTQPTSGTSWTLRTGSRNGFSWGSLDFLMVNLRYNVGLPR